MASEWTRAFLHAMSLAVAPMVLLICLSSTTARKWFVEMNRRGPFYKLCVWLWQRMKAVLTWSISASVGAIAGDRLDSSPPSVCDITATLGSASAELAWVHPPQAIFQSHRRKFRVQYQAAESVPDPRRWLAMPLYSDAKCKLTELEPGVRR